MGNKMKEASNEVALGRWAEAEPAYRSRIALMAKAARSDIPGFDQDDYESELLEVLWLACVRYSPNSGANFNTFFNLLANNRRRDLVRAAWRDSRKANNHSEAIDNDDVRSYIESANSVDSSEEYALALMAVGERLQTRTVKRRRRSVKKSA